MAEKRQIANITKVPDRKKYLQKARKQEIGRVLWQVLGILLLVGIVALLWWGGSTVLDSADETPPPREDQPENVNYI